MIDIFSIFDKGGSLLFSEKYNASVKNEETINVLINSVLLEERSSAKMWTQGEYTYKWTLDNELGLVFVAVYLNLSQLLYIEDLLDAVSCWMRKLCALRFEFIDLIHFSWLLFCFIRTLCQFTASCIYF